MAKEASTFIANHRDKPFYMSYWAFSVHAPWQAKADVIEKYRSKIKANSTQKNPMYAAMVESLDQAVGRLIDAVDNAGLRDNTVIVFFSDNGGVHWPLTKPGLMHPEFDGTPATSNAPPSAAAKQPSTRAAPASPASSFGPDTPSPVPSATNSSKASISTLRSSPSPATSPTQISPSTASTSAPPSKANVSSATRSSATSPTTRR